MGQRNHCQKCGNKNLYFVANVPYTPAEQKEYEKFAAMCAQQGMQGQDKFVGAVSVHCDFWFEIPKSRLKKLKDGDWHLQRPDVDNCKKSVLDACNLLVWADDCTIAQISATKRWTTGMPRTEVRVESL
jgi:Holliday junction resolvase RusA-like endonuclease